MPRLVDTSIRLLSQEPLAGRLSTARTLQLASILDRAGFAVLEISGGGCFDAAVRRGVESPWERIRALKSRCETPLGIALRGRFLVGSKPVGRDLVRRFVASAAESGIDVFRLHDPLNDLANLEDAASAIRAAGRELAIGLVHSPGPTGEIDALLERARRVGELGAGRVLVHDPTGSLDPGRARELVERLGEASGLPCGMYCQGAAGVALAAALEGVRAGAELVACAVYPVAASLHRVSAEALTRALASLGIDTGADLAALWRASELVDGALDDEPVAPLSPRVAVRSAEYHLPAGLVAELDGMLRADGSPDRLDEVLQEVTAIRAELGWPPVASPVAQILGSQALVHVLTAQRWQFLVDGVRELVDGRYGSPPAEIDATLRRAVELRDDVADAGEDEPQRLDEVREAAGDVAASEEDLLLLALFGGSAEPLLRAVRMRGRRDDVLDESGLASDANARIRELIAIVQEAAIGSVTIEEDGMRITVRKSEERPEAGRAVVAELAAASAEPPPAPVRPQSDGFLRVESPMVGTFYRAPAPGAAAFVEVGDPVAAGQTLCILEAMKLMNEIKAESEGVVHRICVDNAEPVEYGQLLFELEPLNGRPLDAV
jgi:oxaloacetate decarboxylase alpha subunit